MLKGMAGLQGMEVVVLQESWRVDDILSILRSGSRVIIVGGAAAWARRRRVIMPNWLG